MRTICKNPECARKGKTFTAKRADALYCSSRCRVAAHRGRQAPVMRTGWFGAVPKMRSVKATLAKQLLELAYSADGGKPKTGRRYYYLALSYGYI